MKSVLDNAKNKTGVEYLYVIDANYGEEGVYFADGMKPGDDAGDIGDFGDTDPVYNFADEMLETIDSGKDDVNAIYDSGDYGMLVSGFAPVFDENNTIIAVVGVDVSADDALAESNKFGIYLIVVIILVNAVFTLISVIYTKNSVGKPLKMPAEASMEIARGNIDVNLDIKSKDDIGLLAVDFTKVSAAVRALIQDIEKMSLEQDSGNMDYFIDVQNSRVRLITLRSG